MLMEVCVEIRKGSGRAPCVCAAPENPRSTSCRILNTEGVSPHTRFK